MWRFILLLVLLLAFPDAQARNPLHIPHGGGVGSTPPVQPVISNLVLSNNTLTCPGGATNVPSGTILGTVAVTETLNGAATPFTGTLLLTGTNANSFAPTGSAPTYSIQTITPLACGQNVSFNIAPNQAGAQLSCPGVPGCSFNESIAVTSSAPQIADVLLNGNSFIGGSPSGTVIGTISDPMTSGSFTGTNTVDDTTHFQIVADNTLETSGVVPSGLYPVNICGVMSGASNSPLCRSFTITGNASGQANGNCASGATADGCVIFAGGTKTLVDNQAAVWSFNNAVTQTNGGYTQIMKNGIGSVNNSNNASWGSNGDAIVLKGGKAYTRSWSQFWFDTTQTSSFNPPGLQIVPAPMQTTTFDPAWLTVAAGAAATALNIQAPTNTLYAQANLTITADELPTNGTIVLADGVTPVTAGQALAQAQLTGLKFIANAGRKDAQHSSFSYLVKDPANQGNVGYAGITVKPAGLWADPLIPAVGSGAIYGPAVSGSNIAQPSVSGDLIGFRVFNESGSTFASGKTFMLGQIFMAGTVPPGQTLCLKPTGSGSCSVYLQMDEKNHWQDGTVKHAILSFNLDTSVSNAATRDYMIATCSGGGCPSAPTAAANNATLAAGAEFASGTLAYTTNPSSGSDNFSCKSILNAANGGGGPAPYQTTTIWLSGPVVKAYSAVGLVNSGRLKLQCDAYSFSDGAVVTDVIVDNTWAFQSGKVNSVFNFSTTQDGFSQGGVQEFLYGLYPHTIIAAGHPQRLGGQYIQYDVPYLYATNAVPRVDISTGIKDSAIDAISCNSATSNDGIIPSGCWTLHAGFTGQYDPALGDPGPRPDIAPEPGFMLNWLSAQNDKSFRTMIGAGRMAGDMGWHFTDESTGYPISGDTYTTFPGLTNGDPCDSGCGSAGSPFFGFFHANDNAIAHHPGFTYIPYMITGNHYFMQLEAWMADFAGAMSAFHTYGSTQSSVTGQQNGTMAQFFQYAPCSGNQAPCGVIDHSQTRTEAWKARTLADGAFILPDSHPTKPFLVAQLQKGASGWVIDKVASNMDRLFGALRGTPTDIFYPRIGQFNSFENNYFSYSMGLAAGMQITKASPAARRLLQYFSNFVSGTMVHGQEGLPPFNGGGFRIYLTCTAPGPCNNTNRFVDSPSADNAVPANAWNQLFAQNNINTSGGFVAGTFPADATAQGYMTDGNCQANQSFDGGGANESDCVTHLLGSAQAATWVGGDIGTLGIHAHVAATHNLLHAQATQGGGGAGALVGSAQLINWDLLRMRLGNGDQVWLSQMNMSPFSDSAAQTCSTSPCVLTKLAETGSTYTLSSANSSSTDIFSVNAVGGSQAGSGCPVGDGAAGCGGGGGGDGTMTASINGADSYMFGGCGAGTFNGGAGNDGISPRANCYGATRAQTIRFRINTTGKTKQIGYTTDYAGTVGAFRPGTDTLNIATNLDGTGVVTPASVMARCTTNASGDAVFNFDGGITLKGVACNAANLQNSITVN